MGGWYEGEAARRSVMGWDWDWGWGLLYGYRGGIEGWSLAKVGDGPHVVIER